MSYKNEIRKLEGEKKRVLRRAAQIDQRIGQLHARQVTLAKALCSALPEVCVFRPSKKGGRK